MSIDGKYGYLLRDDTKIARAQFNELVKLIGIQVFFRGILPGKKYTDYGEIDSNYSEPIKVGCIFQEHPTQQTMKKLGWVSELQPNSSLIQVSYDLPVEVGSLFIIPLGLDEDNGRLFRVVNISSDMVYPSTITCEIVPEFVDIIPREKITDFTSTSFNLLNRDERDL